MSARTGKIARLPATIREELNARLLDNEPAAKILPWLNSLPAVKKITTEDFEGLCINDKNLSDWRLGGFKDWLRKRDRLDNTREMSQYAMKLAKAGGGNLTEGAASILGGRILEVLEGLDELVETVNDDDPIQAAGRLKAIGETIEQLTLNVARLRKGDHNAQTLKQNAEKLKQGAESLKLERDKFEDSASKRLLDAALRAKIEDITKLDVSNSEKIALIRQIAFKDVDALEQSGEIKLPE